MKPALLIIDMQKVSYSGPSAESMKKASETINRAADLFRAKKLPVIWIQQDNGKDAVPGTEKFELLDSLKALEGEKRIVKHYENSFVKTGLADYLAAQGADTPIVTGYCAQYCVLSTYRGAKELDLSPLVLKKAVAGDNEAYLHLVEQICEVLSFSALEKLLSFF
ncbi:MAG: cysteine hydrolase [Treponema sp.]|jgi:nicotinamidase-related amidase|nr:cysteine hydrolase [Treponema sp.]